MFEQPLCEILTHFESEEQLEQWLNNNDVLFPENADTLTSEQRELLLIHLDRETLQTAETFVELLDTYHDGEEAKTTLYAESTYALYVMDSTLRANHSLRGSYLINNLMPANTNIELTREPYALCSRKY